MANEWLIFATRRDTMRPQAREHVARSVQGPPTKSRRLSRKLTAGVITSD